MTKQKKKGSGQDAANWWFEQHAEGFLRRIGVRECQHVADIGCYNGRFTLPVARIVGSCGTVYAIDKNQEMLATVQERSKAEHQHNIRLIEGDLTTERFAAMDGESVDLALLYDMLHRGYLPEKTQRRTVLEHVHRIVKPGGVLSCYPTHLRNYGFTFEELLGEIAEAGFVLKGEKRRRLAHDGRVVRGRVFTFLKPKPRE